MIAISLGDTESALSRGLLTSGRAKRAALAVTALPAKPSPFARPARPAFVDPSLPTARERAQVAIKLVMQLQKWLGVRVDGVIGPETRAAYSKMIAALPPSPGALLDPYGA